MKAKSLVLQATIAAFIGCVATLIVDYLVGNTQLFNDLETDASNRLARLVKPLTPSDNIILVLLDEKSGKTLAEKRSDELLNRKHFGDFFLKMAENKAAVVHSDIYFEVDVPSEDPEFISLVNKAADLSTTEFVFTYASKDAGYSSETIDGFAYHFKIASEFEKVKDKVWIGHSLPFSPDEIAIGCNPARHDLERDVEHWHTSLLTSWLFLRLDPKNAALEPGYLSLPPWEAQLGPNEDFTLQWIDKKRSFRTISFVDALKADPDIFRNKIVLLGDVRTSEDIHHTNYGTVQGVYIVANLINTALANNKERVKVSDYQFEYIAIIILSITTALLVLSRQKWLISTAIILPFLVSIGLPIFAASQFITAYSVAWPLMSMLLALMASLAVLAVQIAPRDTRTPGQISEATILFSDIASSTEWVQKLGAAEYQRRYGVWLDHCEKAIRKCGGQIERTTGDGFIAVFPQQSTVATPACLNATLDISEGMKHGELRASFGFESGPVSGGFLIESGRRVWSSSGTTVNMAKRLQSLADSVGSQIVFGPIAARVLAESHSIRSLGHHPLKGIEGDVECFAISIDE